MNVCRTFIRRNSLWIALFLAGTALHCFSLWLERADLTDILYFALLDICLYAVIFVAGLWLYQKKVRHLEEIGRQSVFNEKDLPEARDSIEEGYSRIIENIDAERHSAFNDTRKMQADMKDYYSMWVHQIKTPIAALQLLLQVQRSEWENTEAPEDVCIRQMQVTSEMEEEMFRIEQYVGMALQYQRINSDSNDFVLEQVPLDSVIREAIHKYAKVMIRKRIPLRYGGCSEVVVTDAKWLSFVVEQLLSNAVKYTKEGEIEVTVEKGENECFFCVSDHGCGIREEDIPRVFEKGYTGFNGHQDKHSTGIGLYLCRQILDKLGHTISLESRIGEGTKVRIGFSTKEG